MPKRAWQRPDNPKSKLLPQPDGGFIAGNHVVKLHGAKAQPARRAQAMLGHDAAHSHPSSRRRDHKGGVRHVRTWAGLIGSQEVGASDGVISFGDIGPVPRRAPVSESVVSFHRRIESISIPRRHDGMKDLPDRRAIRLLSYANA